MNLLSVKNEKVKFSMYGEQLNFSEKKKEKQYTFSFNDISFNRNN